MASICEGCTTRYATGLDVCPQCGSEKRHDEHEVTEVTPAATTAERGEDADDGDGEASEM